MKDDIALGMLVVRELGLRNLIVEAAGIAWHVLRLDVDHVAVKARFRRRVVVESSQVSEAVHEMILLGEVVYASDLATRCPDAEVCCVEL